MVLTVFLGVFLLAPARTRAALPKLEIKFEGKNLTTGSDWQSPVKTSPGDLVRFRATLVNTVPGTIVRDLTVRIPLFKSRAVTQIPHVQTRANNVTTRIEELVVEIDKGAAMEYVAGSGSLQVAGVTSKLSPDTVTDNVTLREIKIGDLSSGEGNAAVISFEAKSTIASEVTAVATSDNAATVSAVAKVTPKTGVGDFIPAGALTWLGWGAFGWGLKRVARSILEM